VRSGALKRTRRKTGRRKRRVLGMVEDAAAVATGIALAFGFGVAAPGEVRTPDRALLPPTRTRREVLYNQLFPAQFA
jgi:hypothetical protein